MSDNMIDKQETGVMPILDLDRIDNETNIDYDEMIKSEEYLMDKQENQSSGEGFSGKKLLVAS